MLLTTVLVSLKVGRFGGAEMWGKGIPGEGSSINSASLGLGLVPTSVSFPTGIQASFPGDLRQALWRVAVLER